MIGRLLQRTAHWIEASLKRKLVLTMTAGLILSSLCFLAVLVVSYRNRVLDERASASIEINRLLQIGLETAMLNRDIEGLRRMVDKLGKQTNIANVMILAPNGEVRFATPKALLGQRFDLASDELCKNCTLSDGSKSTYSAFLTTPMKNDVLRSINPVRNREACTQCHGKIASNPINGILVVDYDATQLRRELLLTTLALSSAGFVVLLSTIGGIGLMLNRSVLSPISRLKEAASDFSFGQLSRRVSLSGSDEIAALGTAFDTMAERIQLGVNDIEVREHYLQSILDAIPDGVRVIDMNYRVAKANAAFCNQQGRALTDIVGHPCYHSSHNRSTQCAATLVTCPVHELQKNGSSLVCRHRHLRADGSDFQVEVSGALFEIETDGEKQQFVVEVIRDLSKQMRLSQEQRLSEIGMLAAGVAHEIHNPLASIHLGLASLIRAMTEKSPEKADTYLRIIEEEIVRCINVTSRLLKLSVPPSDTPELIVLNDLVSDILSLLNAETLKSGTDIEVEFNEQLRIIASDSEIRMLILNLAQNALHAMPDGGRLKVTGQLYRDTVTLSFEDTGVGIRPDDLAKVFDPFWSRRADGVQGTGLGLSICQEIIKHTGGDISVSSERGKGSRFVVTLPSADLQVKPS